MLSFSGTLLIPIQEWYYHQTRQTSAKSRYIIVNDFDPVLNIFMSLQWRKLLIHMEKARDHGFLDVDCPQVEYNYKDYNQS